MNALMLLSGREALPQSIKDGMPGFELFGFFLQEGSQMGALGQERLRPESWHPQVESLRRRALTHPLIYLT